MNDPVDDDEPIDDGIKPTIQVDSNAASNSPAAGLSDTPETDDTADLAQTLHRVLETKLKKFTLLRKLGSGGFGSVWLAQDGQLNRKVAIKTPHPMVGEHADAFYQRVLREGRAAAALQHPSIIAVYEVDELDGVPYIVCEYIKGISLADRLAMKRMPISEAIRVAIPVAEALANAHDAGIIHRDVKPANILLDSRGSPHIGDFGIAKYESAEETISTRGSVIGTPAYMSPEQASGYSQDADARSDVYSLGVVLFQMLTGERPFRGNRQMLVHQVINDDPPPLRKLENSIPRDLDTICLKCLEKEPARRYQSCRELAAELTRVRDGEPIVARPISRAERFYRLCMKHRAVSGLAGALVASLLIGLAGVTWQWKRAEDFGTKQQIARRAADRLSNELAEQVDHSRRLIYNSRIALGRDAWMKGDYFNLRQQLTLAQQPDFEKDRRDFEWYMLAEVFRPVQRIHQHTEFVTDVAISPDGELTAAAGLRSIAIWNTPTGDLRGTLKGHQSRIVSIAFSPNGRLLASLDEKGSIRVWDPYKCQAAMPPMSHPLGGTRIKFSPAGDLLVTAGNSGSIIVWDHDQGKQIRMIDVSDNPVYDFAWMNRANEIVAGSQDGNVTICETESGETVRQWQARRPPSRVISVAVHPTRDLIAASLFSGDLILLDPNEQEPIGEIESAGLKSSLMFMKTQPLLASVNMLGSIDFWSTNDRTLVKQVRTHGSMQSQASLAFDPDENRLAVGSNDGTVKLFRVKQLLKHRTYLGDHEKPITMFRFTDDAKSLISAGKDGRANLYDARTGSFRRQLMQHDSSLECVSTSTDGSKLFFGTADGDVLICDGNSGEVVDTLSVSGKAIRAIADLPNANQIITAGADGGIRVCKIDDRSSELLYTHSGVVRAAIVTTNADTLITAGTDGSIRLVNTSDWTVERQFDDAGAGIFSAAISASEKLLAVGLQTGQVRILNLDQGTWTSTLQVHAGPVQAVTFTGSDETIISGGNDKSIVISDLEIGEQKMNLSYHARQVRCIALSPDGSVLVTSDNGGEAKLWRAPRPAPTLDRFDPE